MPGYSGSQKRWKGRQQTPDWPVFIHGQGIREPCGANGLAIGPTVQKLTGFEVAVIMGPFNANLSKTKTDIEIP